MDDLACLFSDLSRLSPSSPEYTELRNRIALANIGLVFFAAGNRRHPTIQQEDLVQAGFCSLLHAVSKFDPGAGTKFSTYALPWISRGMQSVIADNYPIRVDAREVSRMRAFERSPKAQARSPKDHRQIRAFARLRAAMSQAIRIDASPDPDSWAATSLGLARFDPDPTERLDASEITKRLLDRLPDNERRVLVLRFGLEGPEPLTLAEVAAIIGVKGERVRQIEIAATKKIISLANVLGLTDQLAPEAPDPERQSREKITKYNRLGSKAHRSDRQRGKLVDR